MLRVIAELRARLARPGALTLATGVVVCVAAALRYARQTLDAFGGFTIDDAGITYAYADNLARLQGLRLSPSEPPVEGFSNFLQVLLLEPFAAAGADLARVAKLLNVGALALALAASSLMVWRRLRGPERLFAIVPSWLAGYWLGFSYWVVAGLENGLLAALQIAGLLALLAAPRSRASDGVLGGAAGLLAWCRPEGIAYGALLVAARLLTKPRRWLAPGIAAALVLLLVVVRWLAFRAVVPNTYWAKVEPGRDLAGDGWLYVADFFAARSWYLTVPLPFLAAFTHRARTAALAAYALLVVAIAFAVRAGGDWMVEWRFVQPAMGPLVFASALGLLAILEPAPSAEPPTGKARAWRAALAAAALWPAVLLMLTPPDWSARVRDVASRRNVSLERIAAASSAYRKVRNRLHLGRRPLHADIDVGGMAYRSGLDVIDLAGLTDATLARGWTRAPATVVDYLFGQRLPDTIHLHGAWLDATPVAALSPFVWLYRPFASPLLDELGLAAVTAVRGELVDPTAAPVARASSRLPGAVLTGLTAVRVGEGKVTLFAHARQGAADPSPLVWLAPDGARVTAPFHAGLALERAPPGASLVAAATLPEASLPLVLDGTGAAVRIERWPLAGASAMSDDVESWLRRPLARQARADVARCDPEPLLDEDTEPARWLRGAAFLVGACGKLDAPDALDRYARLALASAHKAPDLDERWDAALAAARLGRGSSLEVRRLLDRGRGAHTPYDEVIGWWGAQTLAVEDASPAVEAEGLRLLVGARRYEDVVREALAYGIDRPGIAGPACTAARRLGLRGVRLRAGFDCASVRDVSVAIARQSFERDDDPTLTRAGAAFGAFVATERHPERGRLAGGHGDRVASSAMNRDGVAAVGELTWGPMRWVGGRFGALLAGDVDPGRLYLVVEGRDAGQAAWRELGRLALAHPREVLQPQLLDLRARRADEVRVRLVDQSNVGHLVADALTFTD